MSNEEFAGVLLSETMTIAAAAKTLGCSRASLYNAIKNNRLRPRRWHRELHVTVEDLYKWRMGRNDRSKTKVNGRRLYNAAENRYSATAAAMMLGVPAYTIHNMLRHGKIKSERVKKFHILTLEEIHKARAILEARERRYRVG